MHCVSAIGSQCIAFLQLGRNAWRFYQSIFIIKYFPPMSLSAINQVMQAATVAFEGYRKISPGKRATFLQAIAAGLENSGDGLLELASTETNLPLPRLRGELARTCFQLRMFASLVKEGNWVEAIIDHAKPEKSPPAPDLRRMRIPIGPVVVFGASNFPFAYSTAGGDTASALAAGCPVVVKQHPAHSQTSFEVYQIIHQAATEMGLPENVIQHVEDKGFETGKMLVQHPATTGVGFTGSFNGGMALHAYAQERKHPIPVFAEMGSTNPVLLLPGALAADSAGIAQKYAVSITMSMGQFCTNPGLIFGLESADLVHFIEALAIELQSFSPSAMLHTGIEKAYMEKTASALSQKGVELQFSGKSGSRVPEVCIARINAADFLENPLVQEEIFGPWSLVVVCKDATDMLNCRNALAGQLTTTLMASKGDLANFPFLVDAALNHSGRVIFNGVPTGVEVCGAMVHGGPHPACTDSRFSAVGPMAIQRWTRPVCWQNAPDTVLPPELREKNPMNIRRMVDGEWQ
jgi:NADP-dependent aldehyde dehydrogenase